MKHFGRHEFACRCGCLKDTVDFELAVVLDGIGGYFGKRVFVNSGNRCLEYNEVVQKENPDYISYSSKSQHLESKAADVVVEGVAPIVVYTYLANKYPDKYGIGLYNSFTHIDVRKLKARW